MKAREIRRFHLFCGLGGGAKGFNKAQPRIPGLQGHMRCIGGVDVVRASRGQDRRGRWNLASAVHDA